jgi:hypothetical protein
MASSSEPRSIFIAMGRHATSSAIGPDRLRALAEKIVARAYPRSHVVVVVDADLDSDRVGLGGADEPSAHGSDVRKLLAFIVSKCERMASSD